MAKSANTSVSIELHGFDELFKSLQGLEKKAVKPILRTGLREAAKATLPKIRQYTPVAKPGDISGAMFKKGYNPGQLRQSWTVKASPKRRRGSVAISIVTIADGNLFQGKTFYGGMVEFGTKFQRAQHPAKRGAEMTRAQSFHALKAGFTKGLERYFARQAKTKGK